MAAHLTALNFFSSSVQYQVQLWWWAKIAIAPTTSSDTLSQKITVSWEAPLPWRLQPIVGTRSRPSNKRAPTEADATNKKPR